jgi:hypothetical protein
LLQFHHKGTIDFILNFTNKLVQKYANSGLDNSVQEVNIFLEDGNQQSQYISHCLWSLYQGKRIDLNTAQADECFKS